MTSHPELLRVTHLDVGNISRCLGSNKGSNNDQKQGEPFFLSMLQQAIPGNCVYFIHQVLQHEGSATSPFLSKKQPVQIVRDACAWIFNNNARPSEVLLHHADDVRVYEKEIAVDELRPEATVKQLEISVRIVWGGSEELELFCHVLANCCAGGTQLPSCSRIEAGNARECFLLSITVFCTETAWKLVRTSTRWSLLEMFALTHMENVMTVESKVEAAHPAIRRRRFIACFFAQRAWPAKPAL